MLKPSRIVENKNIDHMVQVLGEYISNSPSQTPEHGRQKQLIEKAADKIQEVNFRGP